METYDGFKVIQAEPANNTQGEEGYKVVYPDGYTSWSPKDAFENAYVEIDEMDFAHALALAKQGHKVYRPVWSENLHLIYDEKEFTISLMRDGLERISRKILDNFDINATDWKVRK